MLKAKRWMATSYEVGGETITMEIRRLKYHEASPFNLALAKAWAALGEINKDTPRAEQTLALQRFYESLPLERIEAAFFEWVRNVGGIEDDEGPITTGEGLFAVADEGLVLFVCTSLRAASTLGAEEGKGSSSPSISEPEPGRETAAGESPAGPAGNGAGTAHETARETRTIDELSYSAPV